MSGLRTYCKQAGHRSHYRELIGELRSEWWEKTPAMWRSVERAFQAKRI